MKKNHKMRMLEWIERLGLIVVQSEIHPYGPGTRRYMVGKHIEKPNYGKTDIKEQRKNWQDIISSYTNKN